MRLVATRRRFRFFLLRVLFTRDFLHMWGERATPSRIRFVWHTAGRDFDAAMLSAIESGDIAADTYAVTTTQENEA